MARKKEEPNYIEELSERFDRWDDVYQNGCHDPSWPDGVNLNLIRNHIMYYKKAIEESMTYGALPDIYYREMPPEVDNSYIARAEEIRQNAKQTLSAFENNPDIQYIKKKMCFVDGEFLKKNSVGAVMGYETALKMAIESDNLITMRRYEHAESYMESFKTCADKLREYKPPINAQISLFELAEPEDELDMTM